MPCFVEDTAIEGVTRISAQPDFPRPLVGIVGSVHGNEPCGAHAIAEIRRELEAGEGALKQGTLVLIHANPVAGKQGVRYTETGADLNRILDYRYVQTLNKAAWGYEHHRALELQPLLMELDNLFDIHSSGSPTPPFAIVNNVDPALQWGLGLAVPFLVEAWDTLADRIFTGVLERHGKPALGIECGAHDDPETSAIAAALAKRFLVVSGTAEFTTDEPASPPVRVRVEETITKPSEDFAFDRPLTGFEPLDAGAVIGRAGLIEIRTAAPCYAMLPNDSVRVGDDVIYLAVRSIPR